MKNIIKSNNEILKMALERIKSIREQLEKDLLANYSDELFNKLVILNKEIKKGEKIYTKLYPDRLENKWGFIRF